MAEKAVTVLLMTLPLHVPFGQTLEDIIGNALGLIRYQYNDKSITVETVRVGLEEMNGLWVQVEGKFLTVQYASRLRIRGQKMEIEFHQTEK